MKKVAIGSKPSHRGRAPSEDAWVGIPSASVPTPTEPVERTKRLTIEVPLSLHQRVKLKCVKEEVAMADVVRDLLAEFAARE